jgi:hypothetical protein
VILIINFWILNLFVAVMIAVEDQKDDKANREGQNNNTDAINGENTTGNANTEEDNAVKYVVWLFSMEY